MNDQERKDWVNNDEGLYDRWRRSRQSIAAWVRANRELIDAVIANVSSGKQPAHHLKYGNPDWRAQEKRDKAGQQ